MRKNYANAGRHGKVMALMLGVDINIIVNSKDSNHSRVQTITCNYVLQICDWITKQN